MRIFPPGELFKVELQNDRSWKENQGISQIGVWDKSGRFEELNRDFLTHQGPPCGASFAQVSLFNYPFCGFFPQGNFSKWNLKMIESGRKIRAFLKLVSGRKAAILTS